MDEELAVLKEKRMAEIEQQKRVRLNERARLRSAHRQSRSHLSQYQSPSYSMAKKLLIALAIVLTCVLTFSTLNEPALAANPPTQLLTLDDLPTGFTKYSGSAIGNCASSESQGNAFALQKDTEIVELVCVSSAPLANILGDSKPDSPVGIAFIDAMLSNPDILTQVLGQEKPTDLQFLALAGVGNSAIGFRGTIKDIGNTDIAIFRTDKTFNTVFIIHPNRTTPLTSLQTIASKLDQRVRSRLRTTDKQITVIRPTTLAIALDKTMGEGYPLVESFTIDGGESCLC